MSLFPRQQQNTINKVVCKLDSSPIQLKGQGYNDWTLATKTLCCQGMKLHVEYDHEVNAPTHNERAFARKYFNPPHPNPLPHAMRGGEGS
jgi:hypothetical protein